MSYCKLPKYTFMSMQNTPGIKIILIYFHIWALCILVYSDRGSPFVEPRRKYSFRHLGMDSKDKGPSLKLRKSTKIKGQTDTKLINSTVLINYR